jgi:uncharacterized protein (UPF0264 family)
MLWRVQLLVSVANEAEAVAAMAGGADLIDAKDPLAGPLGPVSLEALRAIHGRVGGALPVTAALGDASDEASVEAVARAFASAGATFVKLGFAGNRSGARAAASLAAAVLGTKAQNGRCGVVAVAYADADKADAPSPTAVVAAAWRAGAAGVLLDTADKRGPGLCTLFTPSDLAAWVKDARDAGLLVALAGRLTAEDIPCVRDTGADIVGVRGAACAGGRTGHIASAQVKMLADLVRGNGDDGQAARQGAVEVQVHDVAF